MLGIATEVLRDYPEKIMAHIYVRHMGDLSGGQMIRRKVPGLGKMYKFDINKNVNTVFLLIVYSN